MKKKIFYLTFASLILFSGVLGIKQVNANTEQTFVVLFKNDNSRNVKIQNEFNELMIKSVNGKVKGKTENMPVLSVSISLDKLDELRANPGIASVEANTQYRIDAQTIDWGIPKINAPIAWSDGTTGKNVKVGIVDTGIAAHPDLIIQGGVDLIDDGIDNYADGNGHGTHVAGIVAALNNTIGYVGAAPDADLYAVKVLSADGGGFLFDVIEGIDWCITNDMDIINLSLSSPDNSTAMKAAVDSAYTQGLLIVASAGNLGDNNPATTPDNINYPARYDSVIAVSAIKDDNNLSGFSSTGPSVEVAAPGELIWSTHLNNGYAKYSGTSMAAPFASGILALYKESWPTATNVELRQMLINNCLDLGNPGRDDLYGYGLIMAPPLKSDQKEILSYSLPGQIGDAEIDSSTGTIEVMLPEGSDVSDLVASFTTSPKIQSIKVNGVKQESGITANNFNTTVTYAVTAENGSTKNWDVTVKKGLMLKKDISNGYYKIKDLYSGYYVATQGISFFDEADLIHYSFEETTNQTIYLENIGNGNYYMKMYGSGKYWDEDVRTKNLRQMDFTGASNQKWNIYQDASKNLYIRNVATGDYIYSNNKNLDGKFVLVQGVSINQNQQFVFEEVDVLPTAHGVVADIIEGDYAIKVKSSGLYFDIFGYDGFKKAALIQWSNNGGNNQKFRVTKNDDDTYSIKATHSWRSLDVAWGSTSKGGEIWQWDPNGTNAQKWIFVKNGDGSMSILSRVSGMYLDVQGNSKQNGARLIQMDNNGGDNQKFTLIATTLNTSFLHENTMIPDLDEGIYSIKVKSSSLYLDIENGNLNNQAKLQQWGYNGTGAQSFYLSKFRDTYVLRPVHSWKAIDVPWASNTPGLEIWQWELNNSLAQQWYLIKNNDETYSIMSKLSGLYLSATSVFEGGRIVQQTGTGMDNQKVYLIKR